MLTPILPVEEDGRLNDPVLRENFMTRVYAYNDWQVLLKQGITRRSLTEFHARYKYQLMANHPEQYRTLGTLLGSLGKQDPDHRTAVLQRVNGRTEEMRHPAYSHQRASAPERAPQTIHQP